jgi:hypothetical protein
MVKNKKGQEESPGIPTAIWLAILVIAIIIFVPFIYRQQLFASQLSEDTTCYTSIVGVPGESGETGAKCPIKDYIIYNNRGTEIKESKTKDLDIVKDFSANDNKIYELFAKLMGNCLQRGGGVNSRAFGRGWTQGTVCLECSNIKFDKEVVQNTFGGMREYMENNNVPKLNKKYIDAFTKSELTKEDWINYGKNKNLIPGKIGEPIDKDKIYTIFFMGVKEGTLAALADARLFSREDTYFVYAATQENFNKICDRKVN